MNGRGSRSTRRRTEAGIALAFVGVMIAAGTLAIWFLFTMSVHRDAASVPSTVDATPLASDAAAVEEARKLARTFIVEENLAGVSVAVAKDDGVVWAEGFGWADISKHTPVTPLTRFRLGRAGIPLMSAAVGLLHERGRLDLDTPVQTYVPAFPAKQWPISTRQVMAHVAGIHHGDPANDERMPGRHCDSLEEVLPVFSGDPLVFRPGTQYRYSTYDWILVSAIVEAAAREPYMAFLTREVLAKAGMERTRLDDKDGVADRASFYGPRTAMRTTLGLEERDPADYSCYAASGAFLSTPTDLAKFGLAMMKPGLLKAETIALLQTPLHLESGASTGYGLGWSVEDARLAGAPARMVGHRGSSTGGTTSLITFPDRGLVVAVTSNVSYANGLHDFGLKVAEVFSTSRKK